MQFLEALQNLQLPDLWQTDAIRALKAGNDVVLDAPTGAGKTYVLEQVIETQHFRSQVIYTAPTRALANDKYAEWKNRNWNVGIVTGDITERPTAPILVGTLEAIQGRLKRATDQRLPALVTIDEYQWLSDPDRGNHYEGFCLDLPPQVQLLLLSGSVSNPQDIRDWLERLGRKVVSISHHKRPVPLEEVDVDGLAKRMPDAIQGFWARRVAGALWNNLGPVLLFAPHRKEAERIARQCARELPPPIEPIQLTREQQTILTPPLAKLVEARVAFHHSGMTYLQRAGVVEPLAKAGQLRLVVSTLGLGSGINFSLRSVLVTARDYQSGPYRIAIAPQELLQMIGRAGRRGLDETGYVLLSRDTPRLSEARQAQLKRNKALPWNVVLTRLNLNTPANNELLYFGKKLFTPTPLIMGIEDSQSLDLQSIPCKIPTDTGRARLVRRTRRPFKPCKTCSYNPDCKELNPAPTPVWQWGRIGLLNKHLQLTQRGLIVRQFLGPEGLAIAAGVEDSKYAMGDMIIDLANLFGGERFCQDAPRWSGRLAIACQKAYRRFSIEGWLTWGVPCNYGIGASEVLKQLLNRERRKGQLTGDFSGIGDIDRLLVEWTSLLRQIQALDDYQIDRLQSLKEHADSWLKLFPPPELPPLPSIPAHQTNPTSHRIRWS